LCSSWQDFNWLEGSRGLSATAELLVLCRHGKHIQCSMMSNWQFHRYTPVFSPQGQCSTSSPWRVYAHPTRATKKQRIHQHGNRYRAVVKVRGKVGERRSWAPNNCWRAFPGPTQPLMIRASWKLPLAYIRAPIFFDSSWAAKVVLNHWYQVTYL